MRLARSPGFWLGLALIVLGIGNWVIGREKILEHRELLRRTERTATLAPTDGFEQLSERTNATLLKPFRVSSGRVSAMEQKLDFYRVVEAGGRVITLLGLIVIGSSLLRQARSGNRAPGGKSRYLRDGQQGNRPHHPFSAWRDRSHLISLFWRGNRRPV